MQDQKHIGSGICDSFRKTERRCVLQNGFTSTSGNTVLPIIEQARQHKQPLARSIPQDMIRVCCIRHQFDMDQLSPVAQIAARRTTASRLASTKKSK